MRDSINFSRLYTKFNYPVFPTVRGKTWYPKVKIDALYVITVQYKFYCKATLVYKTVMPIFEIPLELLQWDASPEPISSHEEFAIMLNQFRTGMMPKANVESEMTVLFLNRVCKACSTFLNRISRNFLAVNYCIHCWNDLVRKSNQTKRENY